MLLNFGQPINGVIQVSYVVENIRASAEEFVKRLNVGPWFLRENASFANQKYRGRPTELVISTAMAFSGHLMFELIEQHNDVASVYRETIEKRGYGFHHWGVSSDRFRDTVEKHVRAGYQVAFEAEPLPDTHIAYLDTTADLPGMIEIIEATPVTEAMFTACYRAAIDWDGSEPIRIRKTAAAAA